MCVCVQFLVAVPELCTEVPVYQLCPDRWRVYCDIAQVLFLHNISSVGTTVAIRSDLPECTMLNGLVFFIAVSLLLRQRGQHARQSSISKILDSFIDKQGILCPLLDMYFLNQSWVRNILEPRTCGHITAKSARQRKDSRAGWSKSWNPKQCTECTTNCGARLGEITGFRAKESSTRLSEEFKKDFSW